MKSISTDLLFDSDVIIDSMRGLQPAIDFFSKVENISVSVFTVLELIRGTHNKIQLRKLHKKLNHVDVLYSTELTQRGSTLLLSQYHLSNGMGIIDSLIAAQALEHNLTLVTRNAKHFNFIDSLEIYTPY